MHKQAEKDQFLYMIEQNKKLIFKVCNAYCRDFEDRKDLVQEVIIKLWQSYEVQVVYLDVPYRPEHRYFPLPGQP